MLPGEGGTVEGNVDSSNPTPEGYVLSSLSCYTTKVRSSRRAKRLRRPVANLYGAVWEGQSTKTARYVPP